jgi:hypothetical protein
MSLGARVLAALGTTWYLLVLLAPWEHGSDAAGGRGMDATLDLFRSTSGHPGFHSWIGLACVLAACALLAALAVRPALTLPLAAALVLATAARVLVAAAHWSAPHALAIPLVAASLLAVATLAVVLPVSLRR